MGLFVFTNNTRHQILENSQSCRSGQSSKYTLIPNAFFPLLSIFLIILLLFGSYCKFKHFLILFLTLNLFRNPDGAFEVALMALGVMLWW